LSNTLILKIKKNKPDALSQNIADDVLNILKEGLINPDKLERNVKKFISKHGTCGSEIINKQELKEIQKRIAIGLSINERKQLKNIAQSIKRITKKLNARPFSQIMSGSSSKSCSCEDKVRSFNLVVSPHRV